jgi:hypothetical protein
MRQALRQKKQPQVQTAVFQSYPAPVSGWNTRKALAAMKPTEAVALDNWYSKGSYLEIRGGYSNHLTGMTGNGKTLAVYNALNGTNKLFAATASGVYDASSAGAAGASAAVITNGQFQWTNYGDGGTQYLLMFNGVDEALYYDGASWIVVNAASTPALTGLVTTDIIHVNVFKERLFFIEKASLSFWYLAAGAVGGALTEYPMESYFKRGGYLMAMTTWTLDSGAGVDDLAVFVTSEGELAVFSGTNPGAAATWLLVGIYQLPKPLGRRCFTKYGGDVLYVCEAGAFPLSAAAQSASIDYKLALSFEIEPTFTESGRLYGSNFGWEATVYPAQSALVVNVPVDVDGVHYQYVMNTVTKAWCRFKGWNAEAFAIFNGELYYTTSNKVVKAWTGAIDGTDDIEAYGKSAFSHFGSPGEKKHFVMFRPVLAVNGPLSFLTDIDVDYRDTTITGTATYSVTSGAQWDVDDFDEGYWASGLEVVKDWTSPDEYSGSCASGKVKIATNSLMVQWMASDYMYNKGAGI